MSRSVRGMWAQLGAVPRVPRSAWQRLVHTVLVLLLVSVLTALLLDLGPGDPAYAILGDNATPESIAAVHEDLDLDRPFHERYLDWMGGALRGDLGQTYRANVPAEAREDVTALIGRRLPVTLELVVVTLLLALAVSIPLGVYTAHRAGGVVDRVVKAASAVLVSTPAFVSAPILVLLLALRGGMFPTSGWVGLDESVADNLRHIVLPALALALPIIPIYTAGMRADMLATLQEDFVLNARAKGLAPRAVLWRHAFRPSSFSLLTLSGISLGSLIGGAAIAEVLFGLPGLGKLLIEAIQGKDINTVQGIVLFVAVLYVLVNALLDLAYRWLDPRVQLARQGAA